MHGDSAIRDEIDRSIDGGPSGVPVDELLRRGHRALLRRRLLAGSGVALAVAAVVGTSALSMTGTGSGASPAPGYADRPSASPSTAVTSPRAMRTPSVREAQRAFNRPLAELDARGRPVVVPGATVVRTVENPLAESVAGTSVALEIDHRRVRYWFLLHRTPDGSEGSAYTWSGEHDGDFDSWVEAMSADMALGATPDQGLSDWPGIPGLDLVRFVDGGQRLEPSSGATIVQQRGGVEVGESFAGPDDQTAAAEVETADGARYYVLARRGPGEEPQYIAVSRADGGPSLDAFLEMARSRYADGGGGLL